MNIIRINSSSRNKDNYNHENELDLDNEYYQDMGPDNEHNHEYNHDHVHNHDHNHEHDNEHDHFQDMWKAPKRGIYLLPNLFTTAALFAGFYGIVAAMKENFETAAIALFIAMIMDTLDGRVARLTNTQSSFGAHYDSLSDMVCFGLAPALIVYTWGLQYLGKPGWLASFVYVAATGLRLARFNVQHGKSDRKFFIGLPCPSAAAVVIGMVWIGTDFGIPGKMISELAAMIVFFIASLMVCNIKFYSFKEVDLRGKVPFISVLIVVFLYALIAWDPPKVLFTMFSLYALSGPVMWIKNLLTHRKKKNLQ